MENTCIRCVEAALVTTILCLSQAAAQTPTRQPIGPGVSERAAPPSIEPFRQPPVGRGRLHSPTEVVLPRVSWETRSEMRTRHGRSWLGPTRSLPTEARGEWAWTQTGERVWRMTIRSIGATAVRVHVEEFDATGRLYLYPSGSDTDSRYMGPYTGSGPQGDGDFWGPLVFSEAVTLEYVTENPANVATEIPFRIREVAHFVEDAFSIAEKPGGLQPRYLAGCHLDASCYPDWASKRYRSTALLIITDEDREMIRTCTGETINTRYDTDEHLLVLTAGHCVSDDKTARNMVFVWDLETTECYGQPGSGPRALTYGARLVMAKDDRSHDFALLLLDLGDVLVHTGIRRMGWSPNRVTTGSTVVTISHPRSEFKRIAFGEVVSHTWRNISAQGFSTIRWRLGSTEGGSSGSAVLDEDGSVVGVISGGNNEALNQDSIWGPFCDPGLRVAFNRFDRIFDSIEPYLEDEDELSDLVTSRPPFRPRAVSVALGATSQSITLITSEDGGYTLNGQPVSSGDTYNAANGNYILTLSGGTWTATFAPMMMEVALGASGDSVTLVQEELGGYSLNGESLTADTTAVASNGATYGVTLGADGPMVVYIPSTTTIMLGIYGGELTLTLAEDQVTYMRDGEVFVSGTVIESNGRSYRVTRGNAGNWTVEYQGRRVSLRLGDSGSGVVLREGEDGSWWIGWTKIESGHIRSALNGDKYLLTLVNGEWVATRVDP